MKLRPAAKTIICTPVKVERTKSGLIIVADEREKPEIGVVYAIGSGKLPVPLKVGDHVVYRKYSDNKVTIETSEFNFIRFEDVVAKLS